MPHWLHLDKFTLDSVSGSKQLLLLCLLICEDYSALMTLYPPWIFNRNFVENRTATVRKWLRQLFFPSDIFCWPSGFLPHGCDSAVASIINNFVVTGHLSASEELILPKTFQLLMRLHDIHVFLILTSREVALHQTKTASQRFILYYWMIFQQRDKNTHLRQSCKCVEHTQKKIRAFNVLYQHQMMTKVVSLKTFIV